MTSMVEKKGTYGIRTTIKIKKKKKPAKLSPGLEITGIKVC